MSFRGVGMLILLALETTIIAVPLILGVFLPSEGN